ncbi:choline dehydrogenase [Nitratireductor sp. L1-7-SE]|uniref:Oxygen-dependent choline dehydrogenase n=1 Tax=Nitratireductor rhodophyticola TaxID=2854036 RepID=A0ABS7RAZ4_9HYPH|nr:choline dehydrogenase [Nitratireductor rhodophyticola]MBY8918116.1 choline dehydrogenase [Nitratireductor rhodophyticola]MBY8921075.1 choline dehydrogenase [Nitratireductor rhodophyticola]
MHEADFVIIGSGSAGAALAYRLSEDGKNSVIVIEYGGSDFGPFIQMPAALSFPMNMARYDWGFQSEPEPHLGGRVLATPRGKVIGGSSSINGMVYVRGHARDFDHWADEGATGWAHADVLPYFKRMETMADGEPGWRGTEGPLHVRKGPRDNPLFSAFIEAGRQAGFETTEDYNGSKQEGFGALQQTIHKGRRWSTANAYLRPALKRRNVSLVNGFARRIVIENQRAIGVEIEAHKKIQLVKARREVIVAASAVNSPKLLMLSGVGPAEHLRENGIDVVADRPGVGGNLQDHLELYIQQESLQPITLYSKLNLLSKGLIGVQWLFLKSGLGTSNHFEAGAFVRSAAGVDYPDIQFHFLPVAIRYDGKAAAKSHGFQAHVGPMRSKSRGTIRLKSGDAWAKPEIRFNYMSHPDDWRDFRHCIRLTREIFSQDAFTPYRGREIAPGEAIQSDEELNAFIREHAESAYHPCGTCRMGAPDDAMSVVDAECRVIGVEGLRVADSSIFPRITNGNLNGPSIMVGEKAADHILGRTPLSPSNQEPWINPRWREADR